MATCDVCGKDDPLAFEVRTADGGVHTYDSFDCAAQRVTPSQVRTLRLPPQRTAPAVESRDTASLG